VVPVTYHKAAALSNLGMQAGVQRGKATQRAKLLRATPGQPFWQRNSYAQVIRNRFELDRIREYIASNPL
jgi:hypothetical protein